MPSESQIAAQTVYANILGEINLRVDAISHCVTDFSRDFSTAWGRKGEGRRSASKSGSGFCSPGALMRQSINCRSALPSIVSLLA